MPEDLNNVIETNATGPKRVQGDTGSVEQHDLQDQIEADRYLASKEAAKKPGHGLRPIQFVPPGAV